MLIARSCVFGPTEAYSFMVMVKMGGTFATFTSFGELDQLM
jgi:hypothetical protein